MTKELQQYTSLIQTGLAAISPEQLASIRDELLRVITRGGKIFVCGNGGSAAIAEHFSCDHFKGICEDTALRPHVIPLASNISLITAIGNDIGYEHIFAKQIEWAGTSNDALVAISCSGNSPNIINAIQAATQQSLSTIAFVGFDGGTAKSLANRCIHIPVNNYGVVEDCHQIIMHLLSQTIRTTYARNINTLKL